MSRSGRIRRWFPGAVHAVDGGDDEKRDRAEEEDPDAQAAAGVIFTEEGDAGVEGEAGEQSRPE